VDRASAYKRCRAVYLGGCTCFDVDREDCEVNEKRAESLAAGARELDRHDVAMTWITPHGAPRIQILA